METKQPVSAQRLHALIGANLHDLPPAENRRYTSSIAVPMRTVQGIDAILEILHSVHLARLDGDPAGVLSDHLVEGLIVSGRGLLKAYAEPLRDDT